MEHDNWVKLKGCYANIPFTIKPLFRSVILFLGFLYIYAVITPQYPVDYVTTEEWRKTGPLSKIILIVFLSFLSRAKYNFAWNWMQITNITTGIAYGKDEKGRDRWDFINMHDSSLELLIPYTV